MRLPFTHRLPLAALATAAVALGAAAPAVASGTPSVRADAICKKYDAVKAKLQKRYGYGHAVVHFIAEGKATLAEANHLARVSYPAPGRASYRAMTADFRRAGHGFITLAHDLAADRDAASDKALKRVDADGDAATKQAIKLQLYNCYG